MSSPLRPGYHLNYDHMAAGASPSHIPSAPMGYAGNSGSSLDNYAETVPSSIPSPADTLASLRTNARSEMPFDLAKKVYPCSDEEATSLPSLSFWKNIEKGM